MQIWERDLGFEAWILVLEDLRYMGWDGMGWDGMALMCLS